jgi:hypothetical protein
MNLNAEGPGHAEMMAFREWLENELDGAKAMFTQERDGGCQDSGLSWAIMAYGNALEEFDRRFMG